MKKVIITLLILLSIFIATVSFFYIRFINLDTYTWDTENQILTLGKKQYKVEPVGNSFNLKLEKQIGKIGGRDSFRVWSIKGESIDDRVAIKGFMFPADAYSRIK